MHESLVGGDFRHPKHMSQAKIPNIGIKQIPLTPPPNSYLIIIVGFNPLLTIHQLINH